MIDGLGDAIRGGEGDEDVEASIVLGGGGEVEATGAVSRPRLPVGQRIVGDDELAGWMEWDGQRNQREESEDRDRRRGRD